LEPRALVPAVLRLAVRPDFAPIEASNFSPRELYRTHRLSIAICEGSEMARAAVLAAGGIVLRQASPPLIAVVRLRKRNE